MPPAYLTIRLPKLTERSSTNRYLYRFRGFGSMFSPGHFRRTFAELVSYYAFFK